MSVGELVCAPSLDHDPAFRGHCSRLQESVLSFPAQQLADYKRLFVPPRRFLVSARFVWRIVVGRILQASSRRGLPITQETGCIYEIAWRTNGSCAG